MASPAYQNQQQTVAGTVESVNPKGIKLNGEWHNISKFAQDVTIPSRGEFATLTLDKSGFVRSVETSGGGGGSAPTSQPSQKDRTITRLAVLKAAAEFAASGERLDAAVAEIDGHERLDAQLGGEEELLGRHAHGVPVHDPGERGRAERTGLRLRVFLRYLP